MPDQTNPSRPAPSSDTQQTRTAVLTLPPQLPPQADDSDAVFTRLSKLGITLHRIVENSRTVANSYFLPAFPGEAHLSHLALVPKGGIPQFEVHPDLLTMVESLEANGEDLIREAYRVGAEHGIDLRTLREDLEACLKMIHLAARLAISPLSGAAMHLNQWQFIWSKLAGYTSYTSCKEHDDPAKALAEVDTSAFRPATELLRSPFDSLKAIQKALRDNPWIRKYKPSKNRLQVHVGDWFKFLSNQSDDPLDAPAEVVDAVMEAEQRKEEIRNSKTGK